MRFAEYDYLRSAKKDVPEHTERTVLFLVDAWSLAQDDVAAAEAVAKARDAPAAELAARKEALEADESEADAAKASPNLCLSPVEEILTGDLACAQSTAYPCWVHAASAGSSLAARLICLRAHGLCSMSGCKRT